MQKPLPAPVLYSLMLPLLLLLSTPSCKKDQTIAPVEPPVTTARTFANPVFQGADPWVYQQDSLYYFTTTLGNRIELWKTKDPTALNNVASKVVYFPTGTGTHHQNLWAPELHKVAGKWYMYYTAGNGADSTQRLWVLENSSPDPTQGSWVDKGKIYSPDYDRWAIDGTVLDHQGQQYFLWSGRPNLSVQNQNIYLARMRDPWTLDSGVVVLSRPELSWETQGGPVNEGPQVLLNPAGEVLIVYSASGCWTDDYALGLLRLRSGGNPMQLADWTKSPQPVFVKKPQNSAYGPGHNAFFRSPDGRENWIMYHANSNSGDGCSDKRNIRIQPFAWRADGLPDFGEPVTTGQKIPVPGGL